MFEFKEGSPNGRKFCPRKYGAEFCRSLGWAKCNQILGYIFRAIAITNNIKCKGFYDLPLHSCFYLISILFKLSKAQSTCGKSATVPSVASSSRLGLLSASLQVIFPCLFIIY